MPDRTFVAEFHDVAASLSYFRLGRLTLGQWRRSLQGRRELAWFSHDDALPFVSMCFHLVLRVAQRLLQIKPGRNPVGGLPRYFNRLGHWFVRRQPLPPVRSDSRVRQQESLQGVHS